MHIRRPMTRRAFGRAAFAGAFSAALAAMFGDRPGRAASSQQADHDMSLMKPEWQKAEQIVFLAYPGMTALDLIGPQYMLAGLWGATVQIAAKTLDPITTDTRVRVLPDVTFDEAPTNLDVICVPGSGAGVLTALADSPTIDFLADRGSRARYVTSVCTGSLLLGQAGLLKGYRATSHWLSRDALAAFGAIPTEGRVVRDRNRITGGGVTAGIDFGLALVAELRDPVYAEGLQLLAEYAPEPPFDAGTPERAGPERTRLIASMFQGFDDRVRALARPR